MNWIKLAVRLTGAMTLRTVKVMTLRTVTVMTGLTMWVVATAQVELKYAQNETVTWKEATGMYRWLDETHEDAMLVEAGWTDAGKPLHLFIISSEGDFSPRSIRGSGKNVLFINNGIHPGEPCGVDASLKLAKDLLSGSDPYSQYLENTTRFQMIPFKGYRAGSKQSNVTGHPRLYYDRDDPWEKEIPYYKYFKPVVTTDVPGYYILPGAWPEVVERLQLNQVEMRELLHDTVVEAEVSYIDQYKTVKQPYNGHYRHYDVTVRKEIQSVQLNTGDFIIPVRQQAIEYLVQTLEPRGYDSFFSWNFFDEVLFRNEYFSPYIFEETAGILLKEYPVLKREFDLKRATDSLFSADPYQQLRFIYQRSPWSENTFMRYPVFRLMD